MRGVGGFHRPIRPCPLWCVLMFSTLVELPSSNTTTVPTFGKQHLRSLLELCGPKRMRVIFNGVGPRPFGLAEAEADPWWKGDYDYFSSREAVVAAERMIHV